MTATMKHGDPTFIVRSQAYEAAPGGRRTVATITCRSCGATEDTPLKDSNPGWARRIFKSRGWTVADRPGRHQCPTCARGPRGLAGKSVREVKRDDGTLAVFMSRKHPGTSNRHALSQDSSLANGVLELALSDPTNTQSKLQQIDPDLLKPDRMAEALSHLGHVSQHVEAPAMPPKPEPPPEPMKKGVEHPPTPSKWKSSQRFNSLPVVAKPEGLPEFLTPPPPARQYKRRLAGYRYPGDAAAIARVYLEACGVGGPMIGRDFIVWEQDGVIGWAPQPWPPTVSNDTVEPPAVVGVRTTVLPPDPPLAQPIIPTLTPTVEPVVEQESEPMAAPTLSAVPPARPSREKLLAIHEKLNAVYDTTGTGRYTGLWTDAKIAAELDVPPAWVVEERSRVYGEGTDNESVNIALDKWRRDLTNRQAKATERQTKAIEELMAVNTELEAIKALLSAGPKEGA